MNLYDHFQNGLEKVASRRARRDQRFADALKSPSERGFNTMIHMPQRWGPITPEVIRDDYKKQHKDGRMMDALFTADGMVDDAYERMGISNAARKHHTKAEMKSSRKANSILNRILPGGAARKDKHLGRAKHHGAQAKAHADNVANAHRQRSIHEQAARDIGDIDIDTDAGFRKATRKADAYMKKHFS